MSWLSLTLRAHSFSSRPIRLRTQQKSFLALFAITNSFNFPHQPSQPSLSATIVNE